MFLNNQITTNQKHGILICLPKNQGSHTPDSYRPTSLLTTEYKLLARIMAQRLKPILFRKITNRTILWRTRKINTRLFEITNLMHNSFILQQYVCYTTILNMFRAARCSSRGVFRPRQTRQLPRAVDLKGWLLSCQSY